MLDNYRYERKFLIAEFNEHELEAMIRLHPAIFTELYPQRFINNIYFDSIGMKNYYANIDGISNRYKVRLRWYGDLFGKVEKPFLELKIRNGLLVRKKLIPVNSFSFDEMFTFNTLSGLICKSALPAGIRHELVTLKPVLLNRYKRKYYLSMDKNYRITIDSSMAFWQINNHYNSFLYRSRDNHNNVMELKYSHDKNSGADLITNHFPFRISRNSKYVNGIDRL